MKKDKNDLLESIAIADNFVKESVPVIEKALAAGKIENEMAKESIETMNAIIDLINFTKRNM